VTIVGGTVGGYTLLHPLGEGGMGVVHLARRGPDGERIALKLLRPHVVGDEEARRRLEREVGSLRRVRSRWVAEVVDADPWAEVPYVATRYVPGPSLHDLVVDEGPVGGEDLIWLAGCLAEGVASVHAAGVLHRDVKPSNVLMEGRTPILIDFGLARVADDPRLTHTGFLLGTPGYLAPEILYGDDATPASDVHSWAATVAYAGTGHPPFGRGPAMAIMDRVRRGQFDVDGLPTDLAAVVAAGLDPDPAARPTLDQVLAWLRPLTTRRGAARPVAAPTAPEHDPYTVPLALASQAAADDETDVWPGHGVAEPPTLALTPDQLRAAPTGNERAGWDGPAGWDEPPIWEPLPDHLRAEAPARVPVQERLRRGVLLGATALATGAGLAAYPWIIAAVLLVLTWLLRSGSLAASARDQRRELRGRRWYDGAQLLVAAPWHLVQSIGSTVLLALWAVGLAVAAALVCYAVATGVPLALFVCGVVLAVALWSGPGGSRVRGPVGRVVRPLSRSSRRWLVAALVVAAVAAGLGLQVGSHGPDWAPAGARPSLHLPG
jgi:hypothetical protein